MKRLIGMSAAVAVVASLALAEGPQGPQGPGGRGGSGWGGPGGPGGPGLMMEPDAVIMRCLGDKELALTKEQREQLRTIMAGSTNAMQSLHARMKEAAKDQADLLMKDTADEAAIMKGVEALGAIRLEMARLRMKQMLEARKILTPEQRTRLQELLTRRLEEARKRMEEGRKEMEKRREKFRDRQKAGDEPVPPPPAPET